MTLTTRRKKGLVLLGLVGLGVLVVLSGIWFPADRVNVDLEAARQNLQDQDDQTLPSSRAGTVAGSSSDAGESGEAIGDPADAEVGVEVLGANAEGDEETGSAQSTSQGNSLQSPVTGSSSPSSTTPPSTLPPQDRQVVLIVGSDEHPSRATVRADAVMLLVVEEDEVGLISLPRFLSVDSPCHGGPVPLNLNYAGCEGATGLEALGIAVEDFTTMTIDNFAVFEFAGFQRLIDLMGGYETCVERAVKLEAGDPVFLEPGCTTLDGSDTLRWVRSRQALEWDDDSWKLIGGGGDIVRSGRQRDVFKFVLTEIGQIDDFSKLLAIAQTTSGIFTLDDGWSVPDAVALAWQLKDSAGDLRMGSVQGTRTVTSDGQFALVPTEPFPETLSSLLGR